MRLVIDQQRDLIRERLSDLEMTQAQFAERIGRTQKHVSRVLNGYAGTAELDYWALVLGCEFNVTMTRSTPPIIRNEGQGQ